MNFAALWTRNSGRATPSLRCTPKATTKETRQEATYLQREAVQTTGASSKIMSQNALASSNCYITPVIPDELSSRGVTHFHGLVRKKIDQKLQYLRTSARVTPTQTPKNYIKNTKMAAIVPFLIKTAGRAASGYANIHTQELARIRGQWTTAVLKTVGKNLIGVPEAMNAGLPVWDHWGQNARRATRMMREICIELKARIDAS